MVHDRILGLGSPHGDDVIGWLLIERLRGKVGSQVELRTAAPVELAELAAGCERLILVDAIRADLPPGTVLRLQWPDPRILAATHRSTHGLGVADALRLAEVLGRLPPRVVLFGVAAGESQALAPPSADVLAAVDALERAIRGELKSDN